MLIKKDVFNCSIHPAKLRSSRLPWNSRLSLLVIVNKQNKLHFQYDVCHGLCEGGSSDISSYSSTLLSVSYFTRDSKLLYQFKSKLYLDFASFVNCDQSNLDVNDENSNDSKNKKMIISIFFLFSNFYHFSSLDYVYVVVVFYSSFYYLVFEMKYLLN